jgi:hypothetical protein
MNPSPANADGKAVSAHFETKARIFVPQFFRCGDESKRCYFHLKTPMLLGQNDNPFETE